MFATKEAKQMQQEVVVCSSVSNDIIRIIES